MFISINEISIHVDNVVSIAREAGEQIIEVYNQEFTVDYKADSSPLTVADQRSHDIIIAALERLAPAIPIISEEGPVSPYQQRRDWDYFWLVDPLDGTKEFVARTDEFTVNIALVRKQEPVLGVVYAPALGVLYYAVKGHGSFKVDGNGIVGKLQSEPLTPDDELIVVGSRSHHSPEMDEFIESKRRQYSKVRFLPAGSALKFCLVAEGQAHVYPRLAPTCEWDTAAAHLVATECNRNVVEYHTGETLMYNKPDLLNPWLVCG